MTDTDLLTIDAQTGEVQPPALVLREAPAETLADAQRAATALQDVIRRKAKPVIFGGEQYLEFDDWQTVGRFYGVTAKVQSVDAADLAGRAGFHAVAVAITADGREISKAEAYCLDDEPNWRGKPLFQIASMAQTRACAKALRNVLSWVVVLAGYRATPAEELTGDERHDARVERPRPQKARTNRPSGLITEEQQKRFFKIAKQHGWTDDQVRALLLREGLQRSGDMPVGQYDVLCHELTQGPPRSIPDPPAPF